MLTADLFLSRWLLDAALAARKDELRDVKIRNAISMRPVQVVEQDPEQKAFTFNVWHCSGLDRKYCDKGLAYYSPMLFRDNGTYYTKGYAPVNVAMVTVTPMDKHGFFSFGLTNCCQMELLRAADTIIFEVNEHMPYTYDAYNGHMHISEIDMVVEGHHDGLPYAPQAPSTEIDKQIAGHIFPYLKDGITLQIGIGGMPNSLGALIADSDLKDLGMHTELMSDGYLKLYQAGKITNLKKEINRGKGVFSICNGSKELYEFLDHNIGIQTYPMAYVNDPDVIAQFDNFVSINGCIAMDLYGQVCSGDCGHPPHQRHRRPAGLCHRCAEGQKRPGVPGHALQPRGQEDRRAALQYPAQVHPGRRDHHPQNPGASYGD